jgi:gliding motility-associated-like protein
MIQRLLIGFLVLFSVPMQATHNRAGEITYRWIGGLTYEVTITTYTKESAPTDRCELTISWGDNTTGKVPRVNGGFGACGSIARMGESLGNDFKKNVYRTTHTYPANGNYTLSMEDPNRNGGVSNIPSSINVPFHISSVLRINPQLGPNTSPTLLNPPIDDGCINKLFVHNPSAFDPDGDSLGYSLINCRGGGGIDIPQTYSPFLVQDPLKIDSITGDMIWDLPKNQGQFNFAILITEYRKAPNGSWVEVGNVTRDLQVDILPCNNNPPFINPVGPFCVTAGNPLIFNVTGDDPDGHTVRLSATGGPFEVDTPAFFPNNQSGPPPLTRTFSWDTRCIHVRKQPYSVTFKVTDVPPSTPSNPVPSLAGYYTTQIQVVAPKPENLTATPSPNAIVLNWDPGPCTNASGYAIYRRNGSVAFTPGPCETGLPAALGYTKIATVNGAFNTTYTDNAGLTPGNAYCYRIVKEFPDGAESYVSDEACAELALNTPLITQVSVATTDPANGTIQLSWIPPREMDSTLFPPPYNYLIFRAEGINGTNFIEIGNQVDTTLTDSLLNTTNLAYRYRVDLRAANNTLLAGTSPLASSVYLSILPSDGQNNLSWSFETPWLDTGFVVFREQVPGGGVFDSIAYTNQPSYRDTGLNNGEEYCYRIEALGLYSSTQIVQNIRNASQEDCASPIDTIRPCAPLLTADFFCDRDSLILSWTNPTDPECLDNIVGYNIYFKARLEDAFPDEPLIPNFTGNTLTIANEGSISGCYAVAALDDGAVDPGGQTNEGFLSEIICVESCPSVKLPNVFTPNGDGRNDTWIPLEFKDVASMDLTIRNRWGQVVFSSNDPVAFQTLGWDGRVMDTGVEAPDGVYFYSLTYTPRTIGTPQVQVAQGFLHLNR